MGLVLLTIMSLSSCQKEVLTSDITPSQSFDITLDDAVRIAQSYNISTKDSTKAARVTGINAISNRKTVTDDESKNELFHVINFAKGGFLIISADSRAIPILAHSDNGSFDPDLAPSINGLNHWFNSSKQQMKDIKKKVTKVDQVVARMWEEVINDNSLKGGRIAVNTNCQDWYLRGQFMCKNTYTLARGPLLSTQWGQSGVSNYFAPTSDCTCGHDPAGCGPVAMAQVIRYHQPNIGFEFSILPNVTSSGQCIANTPGEIALANLMTMCGIKASSKYHFFGCNTLTYPSDISGGLQGMGMSSGGSTTNYAPYILKNEILAGYPVIFYAYDSIFNWHIWVCDGWEEHNYDTFNCDTGSCYEYGFSWFHMNYGWGQHQANAWYASGVFTPNGTSNNYNSGLTMITGIRK